MTTESKHTNPNVGQVMEKLREAFAHPEFRKTMEQHCRDTYYLKHEREVQLYLSQYLNGLHDENFMTVCESTKRDLIIGKGPDIYNSNPCHVEIKYQYWFDFKTPAVRKAIKKDIEDKEADIFLLIVHGSNMTEEEDQSHFIWKKDRNMKRESWDSGWDGALKAMKIDCEPIEIDPIKTKTIFPTKEGIEFYFTIYLIDCKTRQ